jgi:prephenate dehydrogenase
MNGIVGIAGLGLIGGSMAKVIKSRTGQRVLGFDIDEDVTRLALKEGAIDGELTEAELGECGLVLVALYPEEVIAYCENILDRLQPGTILADMAGVKTRICEELSAAAKEKGVCFIGGHPMAGIEKSGFKNSSEDLFKGATMILCKDDNTCGSSLSELSAFFLSLGFGHIKITNAHEHDEIIAYTSQLAHIVSSAYIKSDAVNRRYGFTAGSFKDLTRVAKLNENMWAELFLENKENLLKEIDIFLNNMQEYRDALSFSDETALRELLKSGSDLKKIDDEKEKECQEL